MSSEGHRLHVLEVPTAFEHITEQQASDKDSRSSLELMFQRTKDISDTFFIKDAKIEWVELHRSFFCSGYGECSDINRINTCFKF